MEATKREQGNGVVVSNFGHDMVGFDGGQRLASTCHRTSLETRSPRTGGLDRRGWQFSHQQIHALSRPGNRNRMNSPFKPMTERSRTIERENDMSAKSDRSNLSPADEFTGFVANPSAQQRGGTTVRAARGLKRQGLLEKMAQVEVNRYLRVEVASKGYLSPALSPGLRSSAAGITSGTLEQTFVLTLEVGNIDVWGMEQEGCCD